MCKVNYAHYVKGKMSGGSALTPALRNPNRWQQLLATDKKIHQGAADEQPVRILPQPAVLTSPQMVTAFGFSLCQREKWALLKMDLQGRTRIVLEDTKTIGWAIPAPDGRHLEFWEGRESSNVWMLERYWLQCRILADPKFLEHCSEQLEALWHCGGTLSHRVSGCTDGEGARRSSRAEQSHLRGAGREPGKGRKKYSDYG